MSPRKAPGRIRLRVRQDLDRMRHLDLYATVALALVVGVLGAFDIVDASVLAGVTLATLGLVAVGLLSERVQLTTLTSVTTELMTLSRQRVEVASADRLLSVSTSGLDVELRSAMDIRIVGVTLGRTIRNQIIVLRSRLERGARVRIALIEPRGGPVREAARRSTIPESPEIFQNRLQPTLDLLRQLDALPHEGRMEIRLLSFVPAFGLIIVDPEETHGRIDVDIYSHQSGGREPVLPLHASRDHEWYHHFLREFDRIWATGTRFTSQEWQSPDGAHARSGDAEVENR